MEWVTSAERSALLLSLKVSAAAVLLLLPPTVALGWLLARREFPGKGLVEGVCTLPLVLPPVVTGYLLLLLLGESTPLGAALSRIGLPVAFTWRGAALACAVVGFPLMLRPIRLAVEAVDPELEAAARTLGSGPLGVFFSITLPLALPGVVTGVLLAFGATITFVGNMRGETRTLPLALYTELQTPGGEAGALRLLVLSVLLAIAAVLAGESLARRQRRRMDGA
ncbi:MAG: molybdate ABC transporter permease subunit [Planctomycetota bacterium]